MKNGFFRVACAAPGVRVADVAANTESIIEQARAAYAGGADALVFPEMCVTAYTCGDLFHNSVLLDAAERGIDRIREASASLPGLLLFIGAPQRAGQSLYNAAYAICEGRVVAVVPKTYVPNYNEFYERRWWNPAPVGDGVMIRHKGVTLGAEICEDLWVPVPPSCNLALAGAQVIVNLSASPDLIGKYAYLTNLVKQQSARCMCAYAYASAGFGESSTDLAFDAKLLIAENGAMLGHSERWQGAPSLIMADVDIEAIKRDRLHMGTFHDCAERQGGSWRVVDTGCDAEGNDCAGDLLRTVDPHPFVPSADGLLKERCEEIVNIQVAGLCQRLNATRTRRLVIGISGGLDSTLALLVAVRAFDRLGLDRKGILGVTMPGFGTTGRTHGNAVALMEALGVEMREISIVKAVEQHFADIGHDASVHDVTYENCQARERTQILMDLSNSVGGMVLGTGDLSELALGWATYNGDQMSMYGVNAGVPKTLVRHLTAYFASEADSEAVRKPLLDIIDTPISPELIPAAPDGTIKQKTEDLVGPYELHDFFLYYTLRYGFTPSRIYMLARKAFAGAYDDATIKHWLKTFFRRFFTQQFKRSCMPDGPKVGSVCLSPRGDWRMPSDASSALWLAEVEAL